MADFEPFFEKHSDLDIKTLAACSTLDEFLSSLKNTKYYTLLTNLHNASGTIYLSDYETQLDIFFFQKIWKSINKDFKGKEQKRMLLLFGTQIDMLNILWIYRAKKFYNVDAKEIYLTIIPIHYHLRKEQLIKLVEAPGVTEFFQELSVTHYHSFIQPDSQAAIEYAYANRMNQLYKKTTKECSHSMLHILHYLFLKEEELDHITTALECIRYNLEPAETLKYIYNT